VLAYDVDAVTLAHDENATEAPTAPAENWEYGIVTFAFVARWGGFGWRSMCRYMGREDWKRCIRTMVAGGVLSPARGNIAPEWAPGWCYSKFRLSIKHGRLGLPYPVDAPPPAVEWRK
jgi:hypothetical protein